jgi:hypothetical protein
MPALRTRRAVVCAIVLVAVLGPAPAVATSASATAIASSCLPADTERPVVLAAEMGASAIDVSGGPVTVPVRARVVDTGGSGLASVMMTIGSLAGPGFTRWSPGHEGASALLVPEGDDWWSGSITVGQWDGYLSPWGVLQVSVWDRDGNYGQASTNDFRRADGSVPTLTIAPHPYDREQPYLSDLVMGRVAVDVRQHDALVDVAARVTDGGGAGVVSVTVLGASLALDSGSAQDGWWRGTIRVRRWSADGRRPLVVVMHDAAYLGTWSVPDRLRARGLPSFLQVRSIPDTTPPVAGTATVGPSTLDLGEVDAALRVRLRVTDSESGIASAVVSIKSLPGGFYTDHRARLVLRAGTRHDGRWVGALQMSGCDLPAGRYAVRVRLRDRMGNADLVRVGRITITESRV